uniref:Uncharacterized protein n=1 Tax=Photinus pyralis TaxID=7054 RepID=A0A1Y1JW84_PHOPY
MIKMKNIKAIFRRGQTQASSKSEPGQLREDLTRCSSATNLAETKSKGAFSKLRKSASKDKLDKLTEKKGERDVASNNNKPNGGGDVDETLEVEFLQRQLTEMAKEKCDLVLELGERKGELQILKNEIVKLKMFQEQSVFRIEQLSDENTSLRNRLRDVAHSPLSDNEKRQLLLDAERHSSAPASIATNLLDDESGDVTSCPTPDWDKHSSSNVSEVSVACLQDKINQMQETHYSTNEELQATLQELTDLQRQLTELQQDNERLSDEKNLMFDSLCRQTERLNDARTEVESLKQLLYREKDESGQFESIVDREQKLVALLKSAQEERETLLLKQEQLANELQDARASNVEHAAEIEQLTERVRTLESTLDAKHAEHKQIDQELALAKDQCSGRQIEINRLTDLLENARTKINELEQERALNDKSELDELLDNARKEKDGLESEVAHLKEQLARSRNEIEKFREQVSILQEECKVTRNNAKCTQSELEYKCERLTAEKASVNDQLQQLQEAANELQVQAQCQVEDKRQLSTVLSETQRNLSEAERRNNDLDREIDELQRIRKEENEEWEKFQNDLLTSVRVANDFKSEAQQELQKMIMENKAHRERIRQLESQVDKLKDHAQPVNVTETDDTVKRENAIPVIESAPRPQNLHSRSDSIVSEQLLMPDQTHVPKVKNEPIVEPILEKVKAKLGIRKRLDSPTRIAGGSDEHFVSNQTVVLKVKGADVKPVGGNSVTFETLDELYEKINMDKPDDQFTKEEKFVIKLKHSLDEMGRKNTLKRSVMKKKKKLLISEPIFTSVFSNQKLVSYLSDPSIKTVPELSSRNSIDSSSLDDFLNSLMKIPRPSLTAPPRRAVFYDDIADVFADLNSEGSSVFSRPTSNVNMKSFSRPDLREVDLKVSEFAKAQSFDDVDEAAAGRKPIPMPRSKSYVEGLSIDTPTETFGNCQVQISSKMSELEIATSEPDLPKGTLTQTDSVIIIDPKVEHGEGPGTLPNPCLKMVGRSPDSASIGGKHVEGAISPASSHMQTLDSESTFHNARRKFESLIQTSNFRSEVMKKVTLRNLSKST